MKPPEVIKAVKPDKALPLVVLLPENGENKALSDLEPESARIIYKVKNDQKTAVSVWSETGRYVRANFHKSAPAKAESIENARMLGYQTWEDLQKEHCETFTFAGHADKQINEAFLEGLFLSAYQFNKYFSRDRNTPVLTKAEISADSLNEEQLQYIRAVNNAVYTARDLINEPLSYLTAPKLAEEISNLGNTRGFDTKVYDKAAIKALNFEALLSVNRGSQTPPAFIELTHKPKNAVNSKPVVLAGKGIVYDTGGISLKQTFNSMDKMKSDMGGAAAVAGAFSLISELNLPLYVVGLIPATDNRPGENAYVPGDVIGSHKGLSIEVLNTDAEGRLILADALSYAGKFDPELTIDLATLTGSASATFGQHAAAMMSNAPETYIQLMTEAGWDTYERVAPLPMWKEYDDLIESAVADIKNTVGNKGCGAIGAGKFLENFAPGPWIHLDIAGTAYSTEKFNYRGLHGTGFGSRLVYRFLQQITAQYNSNS